MNFLILENQNDSNRMIAVIWNTSFEYVIKIIPMTRTQVTIEQNAINFWHSYWFAVVQDGYSGQMKSSYPEQ